MTAPLMVLSLQILLVLLVARFARQALSASAALPEGGPLPPVTLIKPVKGVDRFSEACFRSWLTQEYPNEVQTIFSLQDPDDPALILLEQLARDPSLAPFEVIVNPIEVGYSGKTSNLHHGLRRARHQTLVFSDADIEAPSGTLARLVGQLGRDNDIVSCLVRTNRAENIWARQYALTWNLGLLGVAGTALHRGTGTFLPGGTVALDRSSLNRIGGLDAIREYVAEDLAMSTLAADRGLRVDLGPPVDSPVGVMSFRDYRHKLMRQHLMHLTGSVKGGLGYTLLCLLACGVPLVVAAEASAGLPVLTVGSALLLLLLRALAVGRFTGVATGKRLHLAWDLLATDLVTLLTLPLALTRRRVTWGGVDFVVEYGGRMRQIPSA